MVGVSNRVDDRRMTNVFERYLTLWVVLCIFGGITLGKVAPGLARTLDGFSISVNGAPVVSEVAPGIRTGVLSGVLL